MGEKKKLSVAVVNHGCKLNQFEGESLLSRLRMAGFVRADLRGGDPPDVAIINTCTVTAKSDRKSRVSIYRALAAKKPNGLLIVTGCYAQTDEPTLRGIDGVDLVLGNDAKASIPELVESWVGTGVKNEAPKNGLFLFECPGNPLRARVFVKVQDGCSMSCSYCKIPLARGRSRSRSPVEIRSYVRKVTESGYREIVLTGINIGDYRFEDLRLSGLLRLLLGTGKDFRIRLSSIEPFSITDDLLEALGDPRIVPHFHVPVQSGSDRILGLMGRPYTSGQYRRVLERMMALRPDCHCATDIITGFPSESRDDFSKTMELVQEIGFGSLHVFRYSPRTGTRACSMNDDVSSSEKAARSRRLIALGKGLNVRYRKRFLGKVREAVLESPRLDTGITDNYIRVRVRENALFHSLREQGGIEKKLIPVRIARVEADKTLAELVSTGF
jgi:threonylcarbamoyladenosine tRNA methylthiotransferase MtaB